MDDATKDRIVRCAELCEWSLGVEAQALAGSHPDFHSAADASDAACHCAQQAFALAVQS